MSTALMESHSGTINLKSMKQLYLLILTCTFIIAMRCAAQDSEYALTGEPSVKETRAIELLNQYDKTNDYNFLLQAEKLTFALSSPNYDIAHRLFELRLRLLDAFDLAIDKNYDPQTDPRASTMVMPPMDSGQRVYPGMDPQLLTNLVARKKYEDDIAENERIKTRYKRERTLKILYEKYVSWCQRYIDGGIYSQNEKRKSKTMDSIKATVKNEKLRKLLLQHYSDKEKEYIERTKEVKK